MSARHADVPDHTCSVRIVLPLGGGDNGRRSPLYHPGDLLTGDLEIYCSSEVAILESSVSFKGTTRTWVEHDEPLGTTSAIQHDFLKQAQKLSPNPHDMQEMESDHVCKVPFQFRISEQRFPNEGLNQQLSQLPPSLSDGGVLFDRQGKKCMQPLIEYGIYATVTYQTSTLGLCMKAQDSCAIRLIPLTEAGPPLSIDDFPGEFLLRCNTSLRKRISNRVVGDLEVSMCEPRPLPVFGQVDKQRDGKGVLDLKLGSAELMTGGIRPQGWSFELEVKIWMKTFYSTMPIREVASNFLMQKNGFLRVRSRTIHSETRKVSSLLWKSDSMNVADDQTASCTASLPFAISINDELLPSFCGLLTARRYCLKLELRILGVRHSRIALLSPLQVYRCRDDQHEPSARGTRAQSQLQRSLTGDWALQNLVETESPPAYERCLR